MVNEIEMGVRFRQRVRFRHFPLFIFSESWGNEIRILSININGLSSKIENLALVELFLNHDIVFISELKCQYPFSLPGFNCIRCELLPGEMNRGGVALLFKNYL